MVNALLVTLIALALAYVLSEAFRYFGLPRVVGQILSGVLLGIPIIKDLLFEPNVISIFEFVANIGIILLFFFVGLEINLKQFRRNFKESSFISIFNTIIPLVSGFLVGKFLFSLGNMPSLIIGISVAVSSQAVSLDILEELKLLKTKIGNLIVTSGAVDDIFELLLISALLIIFQSAVLGQASFQRLIFNIFIFVLIIFAAKFIIVPFALKMVEKQKSQSALFMGALVIVLLMAYLSDLLGISSLIGALIAGMLVRHTLLTGEDRKPWRKNEISHSIHIIAFGFLIPLFFVNVGLNADVYTISSNLPLIFTLLAVDIIGTIAGTSLGVLLSRGTFKEGMIVGWGVIPKGDTELVIATLALNAGLINTAVFTAIITMAMMGTLLAPIIFRMLVKKHHGRFA